MGVAGVTPCLRFCCVAIKLVCCHTCVRRVPELHPAGNGTAEMAEHTQQRLANPCKNKQHPPRMLGGRTGCHLPPAGRQLPGAQEGWAGWRLPLASWHPLPPPFPAPAEQSGPLRREAAAAHPGPMPPLQSR